MSCHDIGHGINAVMEVVVDLYEKGELSGSASMKDVGAHNKRLICEQQKKP